jgi:ATP-dependent Clp protease protease subunit
MISMMHNGCYRGSDTSKMNELLQQLTGQPFEKVERDTDRDNFMSAQEAKEYGLIDNVLERMTPGQAAKE